MSTRSELAVRRDGPPSGTVTFLFTDIEGSTVRWDRDRSAMEAAVRLHDTTMRDSIAAHNGFVFKTMGDAFCAAFHRPEDAGNAAVAAQQALAAADFSSVEGIRVRMALHTGTADERDGDYFGLAVTRVARLLAIAHGGQVLASGVTADTRSRRASAQGSLASGVRLSVARAGLTGGISAVALAGCVAEQSPADADIVYRSRNGGCRDYGAL
jgi:class 3 adenylate cyclase